MYYRAIQNNNQIEAVEALCERFDTCLKLDLEQKDAPVVFKKDLPDQEAALNMGKALLKTFHKNIQIYSPEDILGVEHPLKATLFTDDGTPTDFKLVGVLDLIIRDKSGEMEELEEAVKEYIQKQNESNPGKESDDESEPITYTG